MLIVANWKAYVDDLKKAKSLFALSKRLAVRNKLRIVLAPPSPLLGALAVGNASKIAFAAQDVSATTGGAYTGETIAPTFASVGATYAIVGHSERRALGDTNSVVAEKLSHALAHGLSPILCIGEHDRDGEGRYLNTLRIELTSVFSGLSLKERKNIIVAYEPLWAINKNSSAAIDVRDLNETVGYIRKVLSEFLPGKSAQELPILYGGSVEPTNVRGLAGGSGVDGFLVGHASVDPETFTALVTALA
jgi:triosephosphate isomerase (TIM)